MITKKHIAIGGSAIVIALIAYLGAPHGRIGDVSIYPTISGALNSQVTQQTIQDTICKTGWTATVRPSVSYTNALKQKLLTSGKLSDYELDHFISIELGGSPTDPNNLWMESYLTTPNAHQKDVVETYLKTQICNGSLTLKQAQDLITKDWYAVYLTIKGQPIPSDTDN